MSESNFDITLNGKEIKGLSGTVTETSDPIPLTDKASGNWDLFCKNESARINGCLVAALVNSSRSVWLGGNSDIIIDWESSSVTVSIDEFNSMIAEMSEGVY